MRKTNNNHGSDMLDEYSLWTKSRGSFKANSGKSTEGWLCMSWLKHAFTVDPPGPTPPTEPHLLL